jgi:hypothetical protein
MESRKAFSLQKRRQLQKKFRKALDDEMQALSTEMQQILCDDLVTALQNRLIVLTGAEPKRG